MADKRYETSISFTYDASDPLDAAQQFLDNLVQHGSWYVRVRDTETGDVYQVDSEENVVEEDSPDLPRIPVAQVFQEMVMQALRNYRCQYSQDYDGCGLPLVDVLSPAETIKEGTLELELLAEHLTFELVSEIVKHGMESNA